MITITHYISEFDAGPTTHATHRAFMEDFLIRSMRCEKNIIKYLLKNGPCKRREVQRSLTSTGPLFRYVLEHSKNFICEDGYVRLVGGEKCQNQS